MIGTWLALQLVAGGTPVCVAAAPTPPRRPAPQRFTAAAPIRRGRVRRARHRATQRALLDAVWQRLTPWVAPSQRTPKLRQALARRVRRLIARYRTKERRRVKGRLRVTLAVTVDDAALRKRLRQLGVRLRSPGLLLLTHCAAGDPQPALDPGLRRAGVRLRPGPWSAAQRARLVAAVRRDAREAVARARAQRAHGAVVISCRPAPATPLPGTASRRGRVRLTATFHVVGANAITSWKVVSTGAGFGADPARARRAALDRAAQELGRRLGRELAVRLPAGPMRRLRLRLRGGLPVAAQLRLGAALARLEGVRTATPRRFRRGETWFALRTVHALDALKKRLAQAPLLDGWSWRVRVVRPAGYLDLQAKLEEP